MVCTGDLVIWFAQAACSPTVGNTVTLSLTFISQCEVPKGVHSCGISDTFADPLGFPWLCVMCSAQCVPLVGRN